MFILTFADDQRLRRDIAGCSALKTAFTLNIIFRMFRARNTPKLITSTTPLIVRFTPNQMPPLLVIIHMPAP
ncbi:MAG TPA: hypothetical protein DHW77_05385 [Verrucomicrobiales bacterium]|nr:hypothetical protein [Verrucomicrobiales bacterium]